MPRPSKGSVLTDRDGKHKHAQFTLPKQIATQQGQSRRVTAPLSPALHEDREAADKRTQEMNHWLRQARPGTAYEDVLTALEGMGLAPTARDFMNATASAQKLLDPARDPNVKREKLFREACLMWLDGDIERLTADGEHGQKIVTPKIAEIMRTRFVNYVFPLVGDLPLSAVNATTLKPVRVEIAKDPIELPCLYGKLRTRGGRWHLSLGTQRAILAMCSRVLTISTQLEWITHNPLPRGWLPKEPPQKDFQQLLPNLYLKLLAHKVISIHRRLLWGFATSYGLRGPSEIKPLRIEQFDLQNCAVRFWSTKVKKWLTFPITRGDAAAFRRYLKKYRKGWRPGDRMFVEDDHPLGLRPNFRFAEFIRRDLRLIGAPESLLTASEGRMALRGHDAGRATFVTQALIKGKSDGQIRASTGHVSARMITRYDRQAESLAEFVQMRIKKMPMLDQAIPELHASGDTGRRSRKSRRSAASSQPVRRRSAAHSRRLAR